MPQPAASLLLVFVRYRLSRQSRMGWLQVTLAEKEFFRSEAILHDLLPSSVVQQMTEDPTKRQLFQAAADTTSLAVHVP